MSKIKFKKSKNQIVSMSFSRKLSYSLKEEMYDYLDLNKISLKDFSSSFFSSLSDLTPSHVSHISEEDIDIIIFKIPKKEIIKRFENFIIN